MKYNINVLHNQTAFTVNLHHKLPPRRFHDESINERQEKKFILHGRYGTRIPSSEGINSNLFPAKATHVKS